jgi:3',5'-cyclic AMP phosphodiesterase CpdA
MRLLHISDLHFWHIPLNPLRLAGKRLFGVGNLILNRAWKFRMGTMPAIVERVQEVKPDHVLITGDLTTTALEEEFQAAHRSLEALALDPSSLTMIPGNHDRYTRRATRDRLFEKYFGRYSAHAGYPWLKWVCPDTAILALDACRPTRISARGTIGTDQLDKAQALLDQASPRINRLLIACHYPVALPAGMQDSRGHGLTGREHLRSFLARQAPHLYFHGHIHTPWSFTPDNLPRTICLNPGAALKKNNGLGENASMLEIILQDESVEVKRHFLRGESWQVEELVLSTGFFNHRS